MERAEKRSRPAQVQYQDDTAADDAPGRGSVPWRADGPAGDRAGTAQSRIDAAWEIAPLREELPGHKDLRYEQQNNSPMAGLVRHRTRALGLARRSRRDYRGGRHSRHDRGRGLGGAVPNPLRQVMVRQKSRDCSNRLWPRDRTRQRWRRELDRRIGVPDATAGRRY